MNDKKWFEISADELDSRMMRHQIMHDEKISRAAAMVFKALEEVLKLLGIDTEADIVAQQELLGIYVVPMEPEGMTVATSSWNGSQRVIDSDPFAWISGAMIKHTGEIYCCAEVYAKNLLLEFNCNTKIQEIE